MNFMNRTVMGTADSVATLQTQNTEDTERERRGQAKKDSAQRALDRELEKASPLLKFQYEEEVQAHTEQNAKLEAVARLLTSLTNRVRLRRIAV